MCSTLLEPFGEDQTLTWLQLLGSLWKRATLFNGAVFNECEIGTKYQDLFRFI